MPKFKGIGKHLLMILLKFLYVFFISVMIYQVLVLLLGIIPVNKDFEHTPGGIEIFVGTNGVHTDILMPVYNELHDWSAVVPFRHFPPEVTTYDYVSMGWGDKGFYINTPTWAHLTVGTALNALFLASEAAMHVTYLPFAPRESEHYVRLLVSESQYEQLINYIVPYFEIGDDGEVILIPEAHYSFNDNFYEAHDKYHLFNTSNNWTNRILKRTGIRAAVWSPLDRPIMMQLRKVDINK